MSETICTPTLCPPQAAMPARRRGEGVNLAAAAGGRLPAPVAVAMWPAEPAHREGLVAEACRACAAVEALHEATIMASTYE